MDIRQLQYLVALAREKHFTRAALACHVTQPTLSGRIRQLEQELGVPIVERGQRFHGFTADGERVLKWAHAILDNWTSLQQDIATMRNTSGPLAGRLSFGVIPSALPMAALITKAIQSRYPGVELTVLSQSSIEILRSLEDFSIDVGLTYLDNEPIEGMRSEAIYMERYCLLVRGDHELVNEPSVSWAEAAKQPLCLLTPDMQNRRIIDRAFRVANCAPIPRLEIEFGDQPVRERPPDGACQHHPGVLPRSHRTDLRCPSRAADESGSRAQRRTRGRRSRSGFPLVLAAFECARVTEPPAISRRH